CSAGGETRARRQDLPLVPRRHQESVLRKSLDSPKAIAPLAAVVSQTADPYDPIRVGSSVQPGATIAGRFLVESTAGTGGMGTVLRARDQETGQPVALKILDPLDPRGAHRFAREAALLAELVHPGIVRYVCHGQTFGAGYLAMEWVEGESLAH